MTDEMYERDDLSRLIESDALEQQPAFPVEWTDGTAHDRCAVCGGLNPGDVSHTRCM